MKYMFLFMIFWSVESVTYGQEESSLMQMVNAEKSFAGYAVSNGISAAFMKFLDDSAKVFEGGKILNGKEVWRDRKTDSMELRWYPEYAEVAASGDFGYTTGPSVFIFKKGSNEPEHKGYFNSIWKKDAKGEWKVLLDMGTASPQSEYDESRIEYIDRKYISGTSNKHKNGIENSNEMAKVEESFIADYDKGKGYVKYGSDAVRYFRPQRKVVKGRFVLNENDSFIYKIAGTGIAPSGDLGFAYGYLDDSGKAGNYLRVWKKEMNVWRIVLDAVTY